MAYSHQTPTKMICNALVQKNREYKRVNSAIELKNFYVPRRDLYSTNEFRLAKSLLILNSVLDPNLMFTTNKFDNA